MATKTCTTCGRELPLTAFYVDRRNKDQRYSECKECVKARRLRGREKARQAEARYREAHREEIRQRDRAYYAANRQKRIEAASKSRAKRRAREKGEPVA
jgi:hypothetical protein